jgi:hypothetical protein
MRRYVATATYPAAGNPTASAAIATTASVVVPRAKMIHTPIPKNNNETTTRMPPVGRSTSASSMTIPRVNRIRASVR